MIRSISLLLALLCLTSSLLVADQNITGTLIKEISDYENGSSDFSFSLKSTTKKLITLSISDPKTQEAFMDLGSAKLEVRGSYSGQIFRVSSYKILEQATLIKAAVTGTRKLAIVLTNLGSKTPSCSSTQIATILYGTPYSVQTSYETSSRGQLTFFGDTNGDGSADIFGPVTISESSGSCNNTNGWGQAALEEAKALGLNQSSYHHIFFTIPAVCSFGGKASISCGDECTGFVSQCNSLDTWVHELGHNLGLEHAGKDTNNDGTLEDEYGDYSCPMGAGFTGREKLFNAPHHDQMGWFNAISGKVRTVSSTTSLNLSAIEADSYSSTDPQIVKIQKSASELYYISYRSSDYAWGQDTGSTYKDKINIHVMNPNTRSKSRFIDAIGVGESFTDSALGIKVCANTKNSSHFNMTVRYDGATCPSGTDSGEYASSGLVIGDSDGDAVTDAQEIADGTDSSDPGSYFEKLSTPTFALWNSFLNMINILELSNPDPLGSNTTTNVQVSLYGIDGSLLYTHYINLSSGQQQDLIINEFPGFLSNSYGQLKISYTGNLSGRMSYYRQSGANYSYAYSIPLQQSVRGTTGLGFNTYQASSNPADASYIVYNWLTLVNLSTSSLSFTVNSYNQSGSLIQTRAVSLSAGGREDIDGGHGILGPNFVGYHEIIPSSATQPYLAQIIRYGSNATPTTAPSDYFFAFPLTAKVPNGSTQYLPISKLLSETNWVELVNGSNDSLNLILNFYNSAGTKVTENRSISAYSQEHIFISDTYLTNGEKGYVEIIPSRNNSLITQSMFYFKDAFGGIQALSGISAREALGSTYSGSYNLYLGMENYLSLSNTIDSSINLSIQSASTSGSSGMKTISLSPHTTSVISMSTDTSLNAQADTYGSIKMTPSTSKVLISDIFRVRPETGEIDFAFPTEIRGE